MISGTLCAVAGALLANLAQFVSPSYMHWARSAELLLMVLLGGMASVLGPLRRRGAFMFLEEGLGLITPHWPLLMGLVLVLVVIYARNGLAELAGRVKRRWPAHDDGDHDRPTLQRRCRRASRCSHASQRAAIDTAAVLSVRGLVKRYGGLVVTAGRRPRPAPRRSPCHRRSQRRREDDTARPARPATSAPTPEDLLRQP